MLNPIKIPSKYLKFDIDWYIDQIEDLEANFLVDKNNIKSIIKNIINNNTHNNHVDYICKSFMFLVFKLLKTNDIENPLEMFPNNEGGKPENGFQLINNKHDGYGIYHSHLSTEDIVMTNDGKGMPILEGPEALNLVKKVAPKTGEYIEKVEADYEDERVAALPVEEWIDENLKVIGE